ncbi:TPA: thermonuclease family protein [Escherichia coli]|nr:thermonuclease family protein [Escherichia coli]HCQ8899180.1 thermonuclease family protein [Escherichia coli]HCQ9035256.1 thermonuclease family protein [Escherichia coli]
MFFNMCSNAFSVPEIQRERYGRILGQVYALGGLSVRQFMVCAAWAYTPYNAYSALTALQDEARQQRWSLWADKSPVQPRMWRH